jgi:DNA-binding transcriptional regulator YiaG
MIRRDVLQSDSAPDPKEIARRFAVSAVEGAVRAAPPKTGAELQAWRRVRSLTQREAAFLLGVGHATIERAEAQPRAPLGRAITAGLARYAALASRPASVQHAPRPLRQVGLLLLLLGVDPLSLADIVT